MAVQMTGQLRENIKDHTFCDWVLPKFTTTTPNDTVVSAVVMMATMKKYFSYTFDLMCGIPQVTLEGVKSDWDELLRRIEKLKEYGKETTAWYTLLFPILSRFVKTFDAPNSAENLDFWQKVCHHHGGGSGPTYFSGWLTAFCVFDTDGKWIGNDINKISGEPSSRDGFDKTAGRLQLDGVLYHCLQTGDIPCAYADVDVKLIDNGEEFETIMVAGLVGTRVGNSGDTSLSETGINDVVKPGAGWWIFTKRDPDLVGRGDEERQKRTDEYMAPCCH